MSNSPEKKFCSVDYRQENCLEIFLSSYTGTSAWCAQQLGSRIAVSPDVVPRQRQIQEAVNDFLARAMYLYFKVKHLSKSYLAQKSYLKANGYLCFLATNTSVLRIVFLMLPWQHCSLCFYSMQSKYVLIKSISIGTSVLGCYIYII